MPAVTTILFLLAKLVDLVRDLVIWTNSMMCFATLSLCRHASGIQPTTEGILKSSLFDQQLHLITALATCPADMSVKSTTVEFSFLLCACTAIALLVFNKNSTRTP